MRTVLPFIFSLAFIASASAQSAFLGVELADLDANQVSGASIQSVQEPSAASLMGLIAEDLIIALDGNPINSGRHLQEVLGQRLPGEIVEFELQRNGQEFTLLGVLGRRPSVAGANPEGGGPFSGLRRVPSMPFPPSGERDFWGGAFEGDFLSPFGGDIFEDLGGRLEGFFDQDFRNLDFFKDFQPFQGQFEFSLPKSFGGDEGGRQVSVQYPESIPEEDRQKLIEEAKAKYGEDVSVTFKGNATIIRVQTSSSNSREWSGGFPKDEEF